MNTVTGINGNSFPAKGCMGKADCVVTFRFDKAYSGKRLVPQWNNTFGLGMYVKLSVDIDQKKCCGCEEVNVIQIVKTYRKNEKGEPVPIQDWGVDSLNKNPYYIDETSGVVGTGGNPALLYDAPVTEVLAGGGHKNVGKAFWSCAVCKNKGQKDKIVACVGWGYYINPKGDLEFTPPTPACGAAKPVPGAINDWNGKPGNIQVDWE
jgi:hypothetical protein